jgi:putrescine:ornithine antiporter
LVNLAVVTNLVPYLLSMGSVAVMIRIGHGSIQRRKLATFIAFLGSLYSLYALYSSGFQAMTYGAIVTFVGWTLYGFISYRFDLKEDEFNPNPKLT